MRAKHALECGDLAPLLIVARPGASAKWRRALNFAHSLSIAVLRSLVQCYVELCAAGALECGDLAPLLRVACLAVTLQSGVVPPHSKAASRHRLVRPETGDAPPFPRHTVIEFLPGPSLRWWPRQTNSPSIPAGKLTIASSFSVP